MSINAWSDSEAAERLVKGTARPADNTAAADLYDFLAFGGMDMAESNAIVIAKESSRAYWLDRLLQAQEQLSEGDIPEEWAEELTNTIKALRRVLKIKVKITDDERCAVNRDRAAKRRRQQKERAEADAIKTARYQALTPKERLEEEKVSVVSSLQSSREMSKSAGMMTQTARNNLFKDILAGYDRMQQIETELAETEK
jgi:hypothetical protein